MKISLNWLNDYVAARRISNDEICRAITFLGFEVEQVIRTGAPKLEHVVVVGEVLTRDQASECGQAFGLHRSMSVRLAA
jgi:phenylalanyl-tRNA synthetase beta chain